MTLRLLKRFVYDEVGSSGMEYGLIAGLIAAAMVGSVALLGNNAGNSYTNIASSVK